MGMAFNGVSLGGGAINGIKLFDVDDYWQPLRLLNGAQGFALYKMIDDSTCAITGSFVYQTVAGSSLVECVAAPKGYTFTKLLWDPIQFMPQNEYHHILMTIYINSDHTYGNNGIDIVGISNGNLSLNDDSQVGGDTHHVVLNFSNTQNWSGIKIASIIPDFLKISLAKI